MESNAAIKDLVKMINEETIFIRKPFGMYSGYRFYITSISRYKVFITAVDERDEGNCENFIRSYINALVNFSKDILPMPLCEVAFYKDPQADTPQFVKTYPFYRPGAGKLKSNVIFLHEDIREKRAKIIWEFGPIIKDLRDSLRN